MDRRLWQDHLIMCSKLIVARAKLYTNGVIAGTRVGLLDVEGRSVFSGNTVKWGVGLSFT